MIGRLIEPGVLEFEKMLDNVLAKRLRYAEIAASQIFDLLGNVLKVELVSGRPELTQQVRLLLRPSVEVFVVEGFRHHNHESNANLMG